MREECAYRKYSTDEERRQTGWIGGQEREVILDRTLSGKREVRFVVAERSGTVPV